METQTQAQTPTQSQARTQNPTRTSSLENQRRSSLAKKRLSEQAQVLPSVAEEDTTPAFSQTEIVAPATAQSHGIASILPSGDESESRTVPAPTSIPAPSPIPVAESHPTSSINPSNRKKGVLKTLRQKASSVYTESFLGVPIKNIKACASHSSAKPLPKGSKILGSEVAEGKDGERQSSKQSASWKLSALDKGLLEDDGADVDGHTLDRVLNCRKLVSETVVLVDERIGEWECQRDEVLGIVKELQTDLNTYSSRVGEMASPYDVRVTVKDVDNDTDKISEGSSEGDMVARSELHDLEELLLASDAENGKLETEKRALEKKVEYLQAEARGSKSQDERLALTRKGLEAQNTRVNAENVRLEGEREKLEKKREGLEGVVVEMYKLITTCTPPPPHPRTTTGSVSPAGRGRAFCSGNRTDESSAGDAEFGTERVSIGSVRRSVSEELESEEIHLMHMRNLIENVDRELLNRCMGARAAELVEGEDGVVVKEVLE
jgi:hypothetical protein